MDIAGRVGDDEGVDGIGILPAAPRMVRSVGLMWCMMPRAASATIGWFQRPQSAGLGTVSMPSRHAPKQYEIELATRARSPRSPVLFRTQ